MLHLKFSWVVTGALRFNEVVNGLWQAAKRPLHSSDVAVGLCRSLKCDAQLP